MTHKTRQRKQIQGFVEYSRQMLKASYLIACWLINRILLKRPRSKRNKMYEQLIQENGVYARLTRIQNTTFIEEGFEKMPLGTS